MTSVSYVTPSHYEAHDMLVQVLRTAEMGLGRGMEGKRKLFKMMEIKRKMEAASPALAAEQRYAGPAPRKFKTATALMNYRAKHREMLKRQMHMYWGFYNGRAELWKG